MGIWDSAKPITEEDLKNTVPTSGEELLKRAKRHPCYSCPHKPSVARACGETVILQIPGLDAHYAVSLFKAWLAKNGGA